MLQYPEHDFRSVAMTRGHRYLVVISGDPSDVYDQLPHWTSPYPAHGVCHIGGLKFKDQRQIDIKDGRRLLGEEFDAVVYDSFAGFDPDVIGIVAGTIKAGGSLVLLCPHFESWPRQQDKIYLKTIPFDGIHPEKSIYIQRLARLLNMECQWVLNRPKVGIVSSKVPDIATGQNVSRSYPDQAAAVLGIKKVLDGQRRRPAVLIADRGRGKSAALGIAAGELIAQGVNHITVTGHHRSSVGSVFKHAKLVNSDSDQHLHFMPMDRLVFEHPHTDLLLVDEAASIPLSLLTGLLHHYPRIAFATTVHGYEGTGKSFLIKFLKILDSNTRGFRRYTLAQPIRWANNDPLEALISKALLLDASPAPLDGAIYKSDSAVLKLEDRDSLGHCEHRLRTIFSLLVLAHYRTRPFDLRHILDAPNLRLFTWNRRNQIVGVALVANEGPFDDELSRSVWLGETRPKGHLLSEVLVAQQGLLEAGKLKAGRIVRIVIHPDMQRKGIGTCFINQLEEYLAPSLDILGASFAMDAPVMGFWRKCGFSIARVGLTSSNQTVNPSCVVVKATSETGLPIMQSGGQKLRRHLPFHLASRFRNLDVNLVMQIYSMLPPPPPFTHVEQSELISFASGRANPDNLPATFIRLCEIAFWERQSGLPADAAECLAVERFLQMKDWEDCAYLPGSGGRKSGSKILRDWASALLATRIVPRIS